jgi:putative transposase
MLVFGNRYRYRCAQVRQQARQHKYPTAGCFNSQRVKITQVPGVRGFDAGKLVNGCQR